MSNDRKLRAAIKAVLQNVPGIGVVHDFERYSTDPKRFSAMYLKGNKLLGWHIRRLSIREDEYSTMYNKVSTTWRIRGFAGLVDSAASELVLDDLIDSLRAAFRRLPVLCDATGAHLAGTVANGQAGLQVQDSEPVVFAGVLAHRVTLSLVTQHLAEIEPVISDHADLGGNVNEGGTVKPCPNGGAFSMNLCISPGGEDFKIKEEQKND